ncbi:MAG TPA: alpha/beta hydrolase [Burkholderiales bacterium]|nr:alpha/beta hydrolase [Burkholderiales bacterium]
MHKSIHFFFTVAFFLSYPLAQAETWQPSPGHVQTPIWPGAAPDAMPNPKPESVGPPEGREWWPRANDVSRPTMTVYAAMGRNTGVSVVVFPGGGYQFLAMDLEGTEICDWLTSRGITCVLLKYRVPDSGPTMKNGHRYYPKVQTALQDAQRTLGLARQHAAEWHLDPHKVGVIGFSAGGHLAAAVSTHFAQRTYPPVDAADELSCRPDFAKHSLAYYVALKKVGVPTEMHLYAQGGHAFGLRASKFPITQWPRLVETWLGTIGVVDAIPHTE